MKNIYSKVLSCITLLFVCNCSVLAQQPELVVQTGHADSVTSIAFSPDGKMIASGGYDNTIKLWDVATGKQLRSFEGHARYVSSIAFSPDGKVIASGSPDGMIKIWDVVTGKQLRSFQKPMFNVLTSVAFSPDGRAIASGSSDTTITLWDAATLTQIRSFHGHVDTVWSVAFSPNGKVIASGSQDKTIKLWEADTGKQLVSLEGHVHPIESVAFSPNGKVIASGSDDQTIKLWDAATGKQLHSWEAHDDTVYSVAFSPDGKVIASGSVDQSIKLWDAATGKQLEVYVNSGSLVAFSPDGKVIASGSRDRTIQLWDATTGKQLRSLKGHVDRVNSVAFSPDGKLIAGAIFDKTIKLWDAATGKQLRSLEVHGDHGDQGIAFSPDGKLIASASRDGRIELWDVATGNRLRSIESHVGRNSWGAFAFSPDGKVVASGGPDNTCKLWDVATGRLLLSLNHHVDDDVPDRVAGSVNSVSFSPDGKLIATGYSSDRTITLWEAKTGKQLRSFEGANFKTSIAFSPDGKVIACGSYDRTIDRWDVATGEQLSSFEALVTSIAYSPDGKVIASGSRDRPIQLWDAATGNQLRSLAGHSDRVQSVAFSPDGKVIVSGSSDATMKLWRTDSDKPVATLISLDKNDWVVVTPDGRFDGSPDGMKLIHYVQDNQPIPLDSFFEQFYTPKLLARVLSGESASISRPTVDFSKSIRVPPLVKITSPRAGESFSTDEIHISVEATDQGGGVDEIRLYHNGKLVSDDARQLVRTKANNKTYDVTLLPGVNTFRATAFNRDRTESNPAEIKIELRAAEAASDLYILAIGLNEYKNTRYNLNYGRADAQAFADAVEQRGRNIFRRIRKQVILDDQATRQGVQEAFNRVIAEAKPQDAFVFYFAGHGVMSEGSDNTPAEFYLVPYDVVRLYGDDSGLATNGVAARLLKDLCTRVRAQKQLIVLDACESAGVLETFARRGAPEDKAILQLARSAGIVVLAATGQDQVATEFNKLGHGVFTYALLQAMRGDADAGSPPDGKITVIEIVAYINDRVPELTKLYRGRTQYPNAYARGQDFPLGVK